MEEIDKKLFSLHLIKDDILALRNNVSLLINTCIKDKLLWFSYMSSKSMLYTRVWVFFGFFNVFPLLTNAVFVKSLTVPCYYCTTFMLTHLRCCSFSERYCNLVYSDRLCQKFAYLSQHDAGIPKDCPYFNRITFYPIKRYIGLYVLVDRDRRIMLNMAKYLSIIFSLKK